MFIPETNKLNDYLFLIIQFVSLSVALVDIQLKIYVYSVVF